ncbi:MAG: hypothetical protein WC796_00685 [Candidatus Pacearchaeota archaeon]|jgi:hypothetical protein
MTTYYNIFERPDGLYERLESQSLNSTAETAKRLGWRFIDQKTSLSDVIDLCVEHNRPILRAKMDKL